MIPWNHSGTEPFLTTDCRWDSVNHWRAAGCRWSGCFQSIAASSRHRWNSDFRWTGEKKKKRVLLTAK